MRSFTTIASLNRRLAACLLLTAFLALFTPAQTLGQTPANKDLMPAAIGGWRSAIETRKTDSHLWEEIGGNSAVYREYGLQGITSREFSNGKSRFLVRVHEMAHPAGAYGLLTIEKYLGRSYDDAFSSGPYYITVTDITGNGIEAAPLKSLHDRFPSDPADEPPLTSHLPGGGQTAGSKVYVVGPEGLGRVDGFRELAGVVSFAGGAEGAIASYEQGMKLLILEFHTPQLSSDAEIRLKSYLDSLSSDERPHCRLRRVGNYVVEAIGVEDPRRADAVINQIRYNPKVYWEGKRLSAIPLAYRPPDAAALEEAAKTARFLLQTFYGIGVMTFGAIALGILTGGVFFYWRRYRRRRLGLDQYFSDAGETVRLNLDDYLLAPPEPGSVKLLGKGE